MTRRRATWCLLATIAAALVLPASTSPARESEELEKWVLQASRQQPYVPSSAEELRGVEDLFVRTLQTPDRLDELVAGWRADHWEILPLGESGDPLWLVREAPGYACGRGCYAFRPQQRPGIVLQAPHSFADKYTRKLALLLFQEGQFAAAGWNTVHRRTVDAAHTEHHTFAAFTRAVVRAHPQAYIVQLHGFAQEKRNTPAGRSADLILSDGSFSPGRFVRKATVLFESRFPYGQTRLYPTQTSELGATTNAHAEILLQQGTDRFLHLELSAPIRQRLLADPVARSLLLKNLQDSTD